MPEEEPFNIYSYPVSNADRLEDISNAVWGSVASGALTKEQASEVMRTAYVTGSEEAAVQLMDNYGTLNAYAQEQVDTKYSGNDNAFAANNRDAVGNSTKPLTQMSLKDKLRASNVMTSNPETLPPAIRDARSNVQLFNQQTNDALKYNEFASIPQSAVREYLSETNGRYGIERTIGSRQNIINNAGTAASSMNPMNPVALRYREEETLGKNEVDLRTAEYINQLDSFYKQTQGSSPIDTWLSPTYTSDDGKVYNKTDAQLENDRQQFQALRYQIESKVSKDLFKEDPGNPYYVKMAMRDYIPSASAERQGNADIGSDRQDFVMNKMWHDAGLVGNKEELLQRYPNMAFYGERFQPVGKEDGTYSDAAMKLNDIAWRTQMGAGDMLRGALKSPAYMADFYGAVLDGGAGIYNRKLADKFGLPVMRQDIGKNTLGAAAGAYMNAIPFDKMYSREGEESDSAARYGLYSDEDKADVFKALDAKQRIAAKQAERQVGYEVLGMMAGPKVFPIKQAIINPALKYVTNPIVNNVPGLKPIISGMGKVYNGAGNLIPSKVKPFTPLVTVPTMVAGASVADITRADQAKWDEVAARRGKDWRNVRAIDVAASRSAPVLTQLPQTIPPPVQRSSVMPYLQAAGIGAAGLGTLSALMSGKKKRARNATIGALTGSALGAGGLALYNYLNQAKEPTVS